MAPELFLAKPYSTPVDVFAFGVLLNEMFAREVRQTTGELPWAYYQEGSDSRKVVTAGR